MKHLHYYKTLPCLTVDVYRVLHAFEVTDPCIQHSIKKLLVAGGRGAKDAKKDVEEAIDSLVRWLEMRREEQPNVKSPSLQAGDQIAWNHGDGWQCVTLKKSDLPNMEGNDLKVSICDSLNLADSFLYDIRQTELSWGEHHEARMDIIGQNGPTGDHYREAMSWKRMGEEMKETLKPYIEAARKAQDDGWIEWKGGKCPVGEGDELFVMNRDGHTYKGSGQEVYWQHDGKHYDIIKYKLIGKFSAGRGDDEEVQA